MPIQFIACGNVPETTRIALLQFSASSRALELIEGKSASYRGTEHGIECRLRVDFPRERDQQKWEPVLRSIALSDIKRAHDLVAKPLTPSGQARGHALADHTLVIPETFR